MTGERRSRIRQACQWAAVIVFGAGYSALAYRAATSATPDSFSAAIAIFPLLALAFALAWRAPRRRLMLAAWLAGCAALYAGRGWLLAHYSWMFLLEHAGIYTLLCVMFGKSLRRGRTPLVTEFARLVHTTLSPALLSYTRSVTWAWTLYFAATALLSVLLFLTAPMAVWSTFANLLGVPMLVLMFTGEYAVRCRVLPPQDRAGPIESIRAYRQATSRARAPSP